MQDSGKDSSKKAQDEILETARKRFDLAVEAEIEIRELGHEDTRFRAGHQWPDDIRKSRENDRRPCLTINRIPQFVRQVTNDQRQNRPSIKVSPVDDKADVETAKIFQGMIRHIEYNSNADVAYDTAFEGAVVPGRGYFRLLTDYCDPLSFEQEILVKRIRNPDSVYLDPHSVEPDGSDANWGFIFDDIPKEEYKAEYPDSEVASMTDWDSLVQQTPDWITKDSVRVAEYFYKTFEDVDLVLIADAQGQTQVVNKKELPEILPEGLSVLQERKSRVPVVKWCKINSIEILEETDWPSKFIPIIPVYGDDLLVDGKRVFEGIVRHAKDPQRMYNYWSSSETETIALAPRAPWIGYEGQFEDHEDEWKTANIRNHAFLQVKPMTIGGQQAPLPQRNVFEPPVQAITQARMQAADDLKSTTGIYDASLGARSNEASGIAIQRRNQQSQTNNFHFVDNLTRSLRHAGRIMVEMIPKVYDTPRAVRVLGEDGQSEIVRINEVFEKNGEQKIYDLGAGKYDVIVETGPSYATKRQEAVASMIDLTKVAPQIAQIAGDLMVRNMDWPGSQEIADRLKKTLPPGIADDDKEKQMPIPPQMKAQMDQMSQMVEQLTNQLNQANEKIETKTLELESRERIEFAKMQLSAELEMAKLGSQESQLLLKQELDQINRRLDLVGMNEPIDDEFETEAGPQMAVPPMDQQPFTGEQQAPGQPMEF